MPRDLYKTPSGIFSKITPHLPPRFKFCEPCAADGEFISHILKESSGICKASYDIFPLHKRIEQRDAFDLTEKDLKGAEFIITNPVWERDILHRMIIKFSDMVPTWLLFDAEWMHTKQSIPYMDRCEMIVSVGRVKWFPETKMVGKDSCCWYKFDKNFRGSTILKGRV